MGRRKLSNISASDVTSIGAGQSIVPVADDDINVILLLPAAAIDEIEGCKDCEVLTVEDYALRGKRLHNSGTEAIIVTGDDGSRILSIKTLFYLTLRERGAFNGFTFDMSQRFKADKVTRAKANRRPKPKNATSSPEKTSVTEAATQNPAEVSSSPAAKLETLETDENAKTTSRRTEVRQTEIGIEAALLNKPSEKERDTTNTIIRDAEDIPEEFRDDPPPPPFPPALDGMKRRLVQAFLFAQKNHFAGFSCPEEQLEVGIIVSDTENDIPNLRAAYQKHTKQVNGVKYRKSGETMFCLPVETLPADWEAIADKLLKLFEQAQVEGGIASTASLKDEATNITLMIHPSRKVIQKTWNSRNKKDDQTYSLLARNGV